MREYVLKTIEENSYLFTEEEIKFIDSHFKLIIKIFRLGAIDKFNTSI